LESNVYKEKLKLDNFQIQKLGDVFRMLLDNRGLEPPQPMMRTLAALENLGDNEVLTIINDRRPMFLYEQLEELGFRQRTEPQNDGSFKIEIFR
jgi:tRNA 2-thiouridine synthesizing protein A